MLHIQCPGCMTSAYADCACPPEVRAGPSHLPSCPVADLDALITCGCCPEDHDHAAASACGGQHAGEACPEPGSCRVWAGVTADARHPLYDGEAPGPCPGGHCHKDLPGCAVCRPLIITTLPGTQITMAQGG